MTTSQIRQTFLAFFADHGHTVVPGSSLIPVGDPSVLLTTAGMQQFKAYFSGERPSPYPRIATVQKCFRATDIDAVGDESHLTFFEMLGNFSFGDYFKAEAIAWARALVLDGFGVDPARVWVTVYQGRDGVPRDDESVQIWMDLGHPRERIAYAGEDCFWGPTGDSGPCGPTTEIQINVRPDQPDVGPVVAPDRYLECWNLVFNQFTLARDGALTRLPQQGVDTGAGLERWAMILQNAPTLYEIDVLVPLVQAAAHRAGLTYDRGAPSGRAVRIVAQHTRAATFLIGDGVMPGNEGRGYVLRRSLRQAVRHARAIGIDDDALGPVAARSIEVMEGAYPELGRRRDFILDVVRDEEARFRRTLDAGLTLLDGLLDKLPAGAVLAGADAFVLYDTYGFPLDITTEVARARGHALDSAGYAAALAEQQRRSRASEKGGGRTLPAGFGESVFTGYDFSTEGHGTVVALSVDGQLVEAAPAGAEALVVLDRTPMYGEAGGQVGDTGALRGAAGEAQVTDTLKNPEGTIVHVATIRRGTLTVGDPVALLVDRARRFDIMRNHSATHLMHAALRWTLGAHVHQAGSLVAPDRLRFDFTHTAPLGPADLAAIEEWVNGRVLDDLPITTELTEVRAAVERGAMALFGEKYGEVVRMVSMGDVSRELCGGTHCARTMQMGLFAVTNETGIAAGVRRIEAVTGAGAVAHAQRQRELLQSVAEVLGGPPSEAPERVRRLRQQAEDLRRRLAAADRAEARRAAERLLAARVEICGVNLVAGQVGVVDREALRDLSATLTRRLAEPWVILLASEVDGKPSFIAAVSPRAIEAGLHAGHLAKAAAAVTGGSGGGRPELAMAGGVSAAKIPEALDAGRAYLAAHEGRP